MNYYASTEEEYRLYEKEVRLCYAEAVPDLYSGQYEIIAEYYSIIDSRIDLVEFHLYIGSKKESMRNKIHEVNMHARTFKKQNQMKINTK